MSRNRLYWLDSVLLALAVALPAAVLSGRMPFAWRYATWAETTRVLSATLIVILPVATLAVAVIVGRRRLTVGESGTPVRMVRRTVAAVLAGWLAGIAPALIWTVRTAGDAPRLSFLLVPVVWLGAIAMAAAALTLTHRLRNVLIAASAFWLAVIGADQLTGNDSRWMLFLPFTEMSAQPSGEVEWNSWLAGVRLIVAAAIGIVALLLVQTERRRRGMAGWAVAGVVVASVVFPVPVYAAASPRVACLDGAAEVCLLTEHRQDLPAVRAMVERAAAEAGPDLFPFTVVSEAAENGPMSVRLAVGPQRNSSLTRDVVGQLAGAIARIGRCAPSPGQRVDPAYRLVAFWFVERTGVPLSDFARDPALEPRLAAWRQRPVEVTSALRALTGRLDSCTLTIDQLPPAR